MGVRLPAEYQEVEYLESTGTQYINTWIVGRDSIYAESRLMFTQTDLGNIGFLGSRQGGGDQRFYLISAWQGDWHLGIGEDFFSTTAVLPNTLYDIKVGRDWNAYRFALNVNGADILSGSSSAQTTYDMYVFAVNNYGTASRFCSARLYLLKISNDNSLLRDYIPCYRKSDNKPGMYDLVTKQFFTNQGTGEFVVGPDVIDSISSWLVARRRGLMKEPELYPVGTDIRAKYGAVFVSKHTIDTITGEYVEKSSYQASPVYMPISPKYTYWKRGTFPNRAYLSVLAFYDKDKNYISYYGKNDYGDFVIPDIPSNARYARIAIPIGSYNDVKIIRTA